ncbi:MAG: O-antigen ligase family protein [Paracoccaceae bacterium]
MQIDPPPLTQTGWLAVAVFVTGCLGAITLGISTAVSMLAIGAAILGTALILLRDHRLLPAPLLALVLILYAGISAILFGGIDAIHTAGLMAWLAGEGRFFLTFWPFIFLVLAMRGGEHAIAARIERGLKALIIAMLIAVLARHAGGVTLFSSHHGAGAMAAALLLFAYYNFRHNGGRANLAYLAIAVVALLGAGSRTSLVAAMLGIVVQQVLFFDLRALLRIAALALPALVAMPLLFPAQYDRLAQTIATNPASIVLRNFQIAWQADPPLESAYAWQLAPIAASDGQINIAIRGLLWARGLAEAANSPILGAGFGRYNDTGRSFIGERPLYHVAVSARNENPSIHSAHNSYIMIVAELGLIGLGLVLALFAHIWQRLVACRTPEAHMWVSIGMGGVITLMFIAVTQHGFGAPIYGLSLMPLIAVAYAVAHASPEP